jgi:hypothetical protein
MRFVCRISIGLAESTTTVPAATGSICTPGSDCWAPAARALPAADSSARQSAMIPSANTAKFRLLT